MSFNRIDTPYGRFQTNLAVTRVNYAFNPRMFFSGLLQYNSADRSFSSNLRLRWEYSPGSERVEAAGAVPLGLRPESCRSAPGLTPAGRGRSIRRPHRAVRARRA